MKRKPPSKEQRLIQHIHDRLALTAHNREAHTNKEVDDAIRLYANELAIEIAHLQRRPVNWAKKKNARRPFWSSVTKGTPT